MSKYPLVNIQTVYPGILLDIRYATSNNFTGQVLYDSPLCFVHHDLIEAIGALEEELNSKGLRLKIFDGYRPGEVSHIFWKVLPDERYIANPAKGSQHTRGIAIDVTLVDCRTNEELKMPTEFDDFTERAHHAFDDLPAEIRANRKLLKEMMIKHGFAGCSTEWWHYSWNSSKDYPLINATFSELLDQEEALLL
jgi:D-alanyl-D-alanine dipeptidase